MFKDQYGDFLYRLLVPMEMREAKTPNNYERMVWSYVRAHPDQRMPQYPDDILTHNGAKFRLTADEYQRYMQLRGQTFLANANKLPWNFDAPTGRDIKQFRDLMERATMTARKHIIFERMSGPNRDKFKAELAAKRAAQLE
jgi:hypothetical protein